MNTLASFAAAALDTDKKLHVSDAKLNLVPASLLSQDDTSAP